MLVKTNTTIRDTMQCALDITANARNGMLKWFTSEHALFTLEQDFYVFIEKRPENRHGNVSFSIFFDNVQNVSLTNVLKERVAVMDCVIKNEGFLATGFHVRGKREPVATNRRYATRLKFVLNRRTAAQMPIELYTALRELPIAEERSEYVKKRIASWEGYLRIQEMNADVDDVNTGFTAPRFSEDFSKLQITCHGLQGKALRKINGFSANITGLTGDIGNVVQVKPASKMVEIELTSSYRNRARRHELHLHSFREISFSNFAELSQVRRLRKGFKDLQDGLAANANLEKVLFEERPVVRISNRKKELEFHNRLNEFQREAVIGAMTAHDLYVIQGPPGTGKTTVISEICYQNAKAGLRTLVASQANLAVDNALGRLLDDQDIRILRYGRTESIEEEGKKFIEENVAIHWKEQTMQALEKELQQHNERAEQLEKDHSHITQQLTASKEALKLLEAKITEKEQAQVEQQGITEISEQIRSKLFALQDELAQLQKAQEQNEKNRQLYEEEIDHLQKQIKDLEISAEEKEKMETVANKMNEIQQSIDYITIQEQKSKLEKNVVLLQEERATSDMRLQQYELFLEESIFLLKLDDFQKSLLKFHITIRSATNTKIAELQKLIIKIKESLSKNTYDVWNSLEQRLDKAIPMVEGVLREQGFLTQATQGNMQKTHNRTPKEIHAFLDRMGRFLVTPQTKQLLTTRNYSAEKYDALEKLASAYAFLIQQKQHARRQYAYIEQQKTMIEHSKQLFKEIKKETIETVNDSTKETIAQIEKITERMEKYQNEQEQLKRQLEDLPKQPNGNNQSIEYLNESLQDLKSRTLAYEEQEKAFHAYKAELENKQKLLTELVEGIENNHVSQNKLKTELENNEGKLVQFEGSLDALKEILQSEPEKEHKEIMQSIDGNEIELKAITLEKEQLPMKEALQQQWLTLLENATDYDLDEIKKQYIQHANVIGTTCVASARRDFMEDYPTFDVVIIDEVSKATPPELLLPMLKGKKIILVGDHHQLPPLMGQETLEEFLEESSDAKEKKELEQLLKESLFERLFRTLPKQNKTMLGIQYRMHEKIMDTITPFYKEGDYALQCGLENSDRDRDHLLESRYFNRDNHLLWFDIPNEKPYFEERVKGGTSRFNEAELSVIRTLLADINKATNEAIQEGRIDVGAKKNVGVISFYGEQVKRIDRLIQHELDLPHLHCRTGSVDKFQGMEMDVIILSFVRNHDNSSGDIGFAKDYRRLNVALSRARELLMIVGSTDMFTKRPKNNNTRQMFKQLLNNVQEQEGYKQLELEEN